MSTGSGPDLVVPVSGSDHVLGPGDAFVTVVEYGDFECPICKLAYPAVKLLLRRFSTDVRFIYRHFPLAEAHRYAVPAAEAAESAAVQGRFWEMHDLLFENQPRLERPHLDIYARRLELDMPRFASGLDTHVHMDRIRADLDSGARSHIHGTPAFFVNGAIVDVSFGMDVLFNAVKAALLD